jgi:hypothetical protein
VFIKSQEDFDRLHNQERHRLAVEQANEAGSDDTSLVSHRYQTEMRRS